MFKEGIQLQNKTNKRVCPRLVRISTKYGWLKFPSSNKLFKYEMAQIRKFYVPK